MSNLQKFIDEKAEELLKTSNLVELSGGVTDADFLKNLNVFSDCRTINNCMRGNCTKECKPEKLPIERMP